MIYNTILAILLSTLTIAKWSGCRISNDELEPISIYSLQSSKFQVKDLIDSIAFQDTSFVFGGASNYIDTFILDRSFCLIHINRNDSIKYFYYFSGDVKEWFTNVDSTFIILSHLAVNNVTYDFKSVKKLSIEKRDSILNFFKQRLIYKVSEKVSTLDRYDIQIIDTLKKGRIEGKGVICKESGQCDTLFLKYIDGGKYTGIVGGSGTD